MRPQWENTRYSTINADMKAAAPNGPRHVQFAEPDTLCDGTLRTATLPGSFGRKTGRDDRTRSYYRSNWDENEDIDPTVRLTCFQIAEPDMKEIDKSPEKKPHPQPSSCRRRLRTMCVVILWVILLGLTGFTAWLYFKVDRLKMEKTRLQRKVVGDARQLSDLQDRTDKLTQEKNVLEKRLNGGLKDFADLKNVTWLLKSRLENVAGDLGEKSDTLQVVRERINSLTTCDRGDDCLIRDCADVRTRNKLNGVYPTWPKNVSSALYVYCDQTTQGGGWTVIQRRVDGSVNFFRNWTDYRDGFGDLNDEFWLGNENLYIITSQKTYRLRIELEDWDGVRKYAEYSFMSVDSEIENYRLKLGAYTGNAGDSMSATNTTHGWDIFKRNLNNMTFSTKDRDNDNSLDSCARLYKGGWWYNSCYNANLNGKYYSTGGQAYDSDLQDGIEWFTWKGWYYSLKSVSMKLRPVDFLP
ncbi:angiopoietin-related protein 7-like isoform X1 [Branchiostoma lanceolatum]|uniref:angiopoietin-related protein 7-like isoform X1 n=2 Tax=Branchiostoma lanceolatum TaxID=7740 RepID=UPI0034571D99